MLVLSYYRNYIGVNTSHFVFKTAIIVRKNEKVSISTSRVKTCKQNVSIETIGTSLIGL
jgi:hypothetical protein